MASSSAFKSASLAEIVPEFFCTVGVVEMIVPRPLVNTAVGVDLGLVTLANVLTSAE